MLEVGIGILLAVVISGLLRAWLALHRRRRERLRYYRMQFFDAADRLLQDETTDDVSLARLKRMAGDIDSFRTFMALMQAVSAMDKEIRSGTIKPSARPVPPGWGALLYNYFLAISYSRPILGTWIRHLMVSGLDPRTESQNVETIDRRIHRSHLQPA